MECDPAVTFPPAVCTHRCHACYSGASVEVLLCWFSKATGMPLVGIWVSGVNSPVHPTILAAALGFKCSSSLQDKACQADGSFLLLFYCKGGGSPFTLKHLFFIKQPIYWTPTRCIDIWIPKQTLVMLAVLHPHPFWLH